MWLLTFFAVLLFRQASSSDVSPVKCSISSSKINAKRGDDVRFNCTGYGRPVPQLAWKTLNMDLNQENYRIRQIHQNEVVVSTFSLSDISEKDAGNYTCQARNDKETAECNVQLTVLIIPDSPRNLRVDGVDTHEMRISWEPPADSQVTITRYIIRYWNLNGGPRRAKELSIPVAVNSVLVEGLRPGRVYEVIAASENKDGRSDFTDVVSLVTAPDLPSAPPMDVRAEALGEESIQVSWKVPPMMNWNGNLEGFYVGIRRHKVVEPIVYQTILIKGKYPKRSYNTKLANLGASTTYDIFVEAFNEAGSGPPAYVKVTTMDGEGKFEYKINLTVVALFSSSAELNWSTEKGLNVSHFIVAFESSNGVSKNITVDNSNFLEQENYTLDGLSPGTTYRVLVYAPGPNEQFYKSNSGVFTTNIKEFSLLDLWPLAALFPFILF